MTAQRLLQTALLCHNEMRDPMTSVYTFLENPSPLRQACTWTVMCFDHAVYLEVRLTCPYMSQRATSATGALLGGLPLGIQSTALCEGRDDDDDGQENEVYSTLHIENNAHLTEIAPYGHTLLHIHEVRVCNLPALEEPLPQGFLLECPHLRVANFQNLPRLGDIEPHWFSDCCLLQRIEIDSLPELVWFPDFSMCNCPQLKEVVMGGRINGALTQQGNYEYDCFPQVTTVGFNWLKKTGLEEMTLSRWPQLDHIKSGLLSDCEHLKIARFVDLPKLEFVGDRWLHLCPCLTEVVLEKLPALEKVCDQWLSCCKSLETFTLRDIPALTTVGNRFLAFCQKLDNVTFDNLPNWTEVGPQFMADCFHIQSVTLDRLPKLNLATNNHSFLETTVVSKIKFVVEQCSYQTQWVIREVEERR